MPEYEVLVPLTAVKAVVVEADSPEEARDKALEGTWGPDVLLFLGEEVVQVHGGQAIVQEAVDGYDDSYAPEGDTPLSDYGLDLAAFRR